MSLRGVRGRDRARKKYVWPQLRFAAIACFVIAYRVASSAGLTGNLDAVSHFNIAANTLDKALLQFGAQAHVQLSFEWDSAKARLRTKELKGRFTAREVLTRLLEGTGLKYVAQHQTIEILQAPATASPFSSSIRGHLRDFSKQPHSNYTDDPPAADKTENWLALAPVIITGSRIASTAKEGPQEVQIYDDAYIDQSGQESLTDFLNTLPSVSNIASSALDVAPTVTLRGLPVGTTLVLMNGRRLESSGTADLAGGDYFDLNNIPLAAVQRIEVEENGSSAVYGSDAIAGVINIILKTEFNGFDASAKYDWAKDLGTASANLAWGKQWQRGGFSIIGSYEAGGGLLNKQRLLTASNDYTRYGGPNNNYQVCSPGNVFSVTGDPLPGAPAGSGATYAAVTGRSVSGKPALSQFDYGELNSCPLEPGLSLLPSTHRAGLLVQGHVDPARGLEIFTELMYTHVSQTQWLGDEYLFGLPGLQYYTVSPTNPYNPFGTTVGVSEMLTEIPMDNLYNTDFFRPLVGVKGTFDEKYQWEVSGWESIDWTSDVTANIVPNATAIQNALNSVNPNTALDPFVAGPPGSLTALESYFSNEDVKLMGRDRSAEAFVRGPLLQLPAGEIEAVVGGDYVRSALNENLIDSGSYAPGTRFDYQRRYSSVFAEARVPLIARHNVAGAGSLLALTAAGRHDQYSDFGGATTDQLGIELRPTQSILVRGTYADAFKAPSLADLYSAALTEPGEITDPVTGSSAEPQITYGGNTRLRPQTGHSHTAGVVYASRLLPGLVLSVTQWNVVENNVIQAVPAQYIVDNADAFPGRVTRDLTGTIISVDATSVNFGSINAAGLDYEMEYRYPLGAGTASASISASETYHYLQALVPGTPPIEAAGVAQVNNDWAPRWKGVAGLNWQDSWITLHVDGRYTGVYEDYGVAERIGNFWIADANVRWKVGEHLGRRPGWAAGCYLEAGATNVFNRGPQFSNYGYDFYGYDAAQMSIVGRSVYVQTGVRW